MISKARFNKALGKLQEYSLVEVDVDGGSGRYSLHACVHDWTLEYLNANINTELCQRAVCCIANSVRWDDEVGFSILNRRLVHHLI